MNVSEFSAAPLFEPMRYQEVKQGEYAAATFTPETTHLATFGLYICKAVSVYNPSTQFGVLAHLDGTTHPDWITDSIVSVYEGDITEADVTIARTGESDLTFMWPTLDDYVELFMRHNPRTLRIDKNVEMREPRGFALCLESGNVYSNNRDDAIVQQSFRSHKTSRQIRDADALWF